MQDLSDPTTPPPTSAPAAPPAPAERGVSHYADVWAKRGGAAGALLAVGWKLSALTSTLLNNGLGDGTVVSRAMGAMLAMMVIFGLLGLAVGALVGVVVWAVRT